MSKYVRIFFLTIMVGLVFCYIFGSTIFTGGGDSADEAVLTVGAIIVILLSFLISTRKLILRTPKLGN